METDQSASARLSPTQRVPFLADGPLQLSDSLAILAHIRQRQGQQLASAPERLNLLSLATTVLDTALNLFFLERDGVQAGSLPYLQRQQARITTALAELEQQVLLVLLVLLVQQEQLVQQVLLVQLVLQELVL